MALITLFTHDQGILLAFVLKLVVQIKQLEKKDAPKISK